MTTMAETNLTMQVYQVFIKATPEQVWEGITNPDFTEKYYYGGRIDSTLEPGTPFRMGLGDDVGVDGEVIEADKPRRLVHTWRSLYDPSLVDEPASRVTWDIEAADGGITKVTVVHDRLEEAPKTAKDVAGGWNYILSGLKTLLETGEGLR